MAKKPSNLYEIKSFKPYEIERLIAHFIAEAKIGRYFKQVKIGTNNDGCSIVEWLPNGLVKMISKEELMQVFYNWAGENGQIDILKLGSRQLKNGIDTWKNVGDFVDVKSLIAWPGESERHPTWHILPFPKYAYSHEAQCALDTNTLSNYAPTWAKLLGNMDMNAKAFMYFIGSIFYEESYKQQYLWLYGQGGEGKSAIIRILEKTLVDTFHSMEVPTKGENHWGTTLIKKRVVSFPDVNNANFVTTGKLKRLTGDDTIEINPKGLPRFKYRPEAKFIFTSNVLPAISALKAEQRRIILVKFKEKDREFIDNFETNLWNEARAFLTACCIMFTRDCEMDKEIPCEFDESIVEDTEDWMQTIFDLHFYYREGSKIHASNFRDYLSRNCSLNDNHKISQLKRYLQHSHGIIYAKKNKCRFYENVAFKSFSGELLPIA